MFDLSKDADALICVLYKGDAAQQKGEQAVMLQSLGKIKQDSFQYWDDARFGAACSELKGMKLIDTNDEGSEARLTESAVEDLTQRFGGDADALGNYLKRIRSVFWSK